MTLKLRRPQPDVKPDRKLGLAASTTTISGWLAMLSRMLPRGQADSIRAELETHLTDRVRDLMVGGMDENQATQRAIAELGEAADMASKYRALQTEPRRRLIMYGSIFAVCGAALALSIAAITGNRTQPVAINAPVKNTAQPQTSFPVEFQYQLTEQEYADHLKDVQLTLSFVTQPASIELAGLRFDADFNAATAKDVFEFVGKIVKNPVHAYWAQLAEAGIKPETPVTLKAQQAGIDAVMRAVNEAVAMPRPQVDWRLTDGILEFSTRDFFDRREEKLSIYDLSKIIASRQETYHEEREKVVEEIASLIREFVYSDGWHENGGDLAKMTIVGDRMFVEAPQRYHTQIKWMLDQLPAGAKHAATSPLPVKSYALKHMRCDEAIRVMKDTFGPQYLAGVGVAADERTNTVIVSGGNQLQDDVSAFIAKLDVEASAK